MSVNAKFDGTYEEREKKIREAVELLQGKFGSDIKIQVYNPKSMADYLLISVLEGIETAVRKSGREAAHRFVDYMFDNLSDKKSET